MIEPCKCWFSAPGPFYWEWRCLRCGGRIYGFFTRWRLRRESRKHGGS